LVSEIRDRTQSGSSESVERGGSSIDAIIDLYKRDVDRTLLREQLKKTPSERLQDLQSMVRFLTDLRERRERSPR
jgi:hypothetical protein